MVLIVITMLIITFVSFTKMYFSRILKEQQKLQKAMVAHQQQLLEDSVLVQERERTRIAADLHDDLISKLNISLLSLHTTKDINSVSTLLQDSIALARQISHDLSPPMLQQSSLKELIEDFIFPIKESHSIHFSHALSTPYMLTSDTKLQVFRIFQEAINNTLKHAQATQLQVHLRLSPNLLAVQVLDNGVGFDSSSSKKGLGLKNIALRSQILNGHFRFSTPNNQGSSFLFYLKQPLLERPKQ
ncbi:hypothetical protein AsAng_0048380 [Aureispira anguillae]|uniref:histidine kinase n=2 Tax=Aureispira anguillae TaxID=2864201 RepID=A0A915YIZ0_9BACT|nr:hypothetical protein AsAng_0048380 [Aureispira anguillae]